MSNTAQSVVAFNLTGDNSAVGLVAFGQGLAMLLLNPFAGAVADRFSKKLLIIIAQAVIGVVMLSIALMLSTHVLTIGLLACAAFVTGCMFSFLGPTRTALVSEFVPETRLGNAIALVQVAGSVSRIAGPFVASLLLAWAVTGAAGAYFLISSVFIFVIATFYRLPPSPPRRVSRTSMLQDIRLGMRHVVSDPHRLHLLVSFHAVITLGMAFQVLMPGMAIDVLGAGTTGLGLMLGAAALGGLVLSLFVASIADSKKAPAYLLTISTGTGVSLILLALAPTFLLALGAMLLVGGCTAGFQTLNNAITVRLTGAEFYGRVIALMFLAWGISSLAGYPVGFAADVFGERAVLGSLGIALCVVVGLLALWQRRIGPYELESTLVDRLLTSS